SGSRSRAESRPPRAWPATSLERVTGRSQLGLDRFDQVGARVEASDPQGRIGQDQEIVVASAPGREAGRAVAADPQQIDAATLTVDHIVPVAHAPDVDVVVGPAADDIDALAPDQHVVPGTAEQLVVAELDPERVIARAARSEEHT